MGTEPDPSRPVAATTGWERRDTLICGWGVLLALQAAYALAAWGMRCGWYVGAPGADTAKGVWGVWWTSFPEVRGGASVFFTRLLCFPEGTLFVPPDPLNIAAVVPVARLLGAPGGYSFLLVFQLLAGTVAAFAALRLLGAHRPGAGVGAVLFGLAPYQWCNVHEGLSETVTVTWLVLFVAAWIRLAEQPRWPLGLACLLLYGLTVFTNLYHAVFLLMFAGLWTLCTARAAWRQRTFRATLIALLALAGTALGTQALMGRLYGDTRAVGIKQGYVAVGRDATQRAPSTQYIGTPPWELLAMRLPPDGDAREERIRSEYLGVVALSLALLGLLACGRGGLPWLGVGVAFSLLALGTGFGFFDRVLLGEPLRTLLPFPWLVRFQPIMRMMNFPYRAVVMVNLCVAVMAARGLDWLVLPLAARRRALVAGAAVACMGLEFFALSGAPIPWGSTHLTTRPYCDVLRQSPQAGAVLDLPVADPHLFPWMAEYFTRAMEHGRPMPYSVAPNFGMLPDLGFKAPNALITRDAGKWPRGAALAQAFAKMREAGFAFVVLHKEFHREPAMVTAMVMLRRDVEAVLGAAIYQDGDHVVYSMGGAHLEQR